MQETVPARRGATSTRDVVGRRRTFAIISHPDAGKTTLTEKLLLFGGARGQHESEIHRLIVAGGIEQRFLRAGGEGGELRADDVAAILGNGHGPGAGNVCRSGIFLAGERVLRGYSDAGQGDIAAFNYAVELAARYGLCGRGIGG